MSRSTKKRKGRVLLFVGIGLFAIGAVWGLNGFYSDEQIYVYGLLGGGGVMSYAGARRRKNH